MKYKELKKTTLMVLFAGLATAAALGVLFATKAGLKLRNKIRFAAENRGGDHTDEHEQFQHHQQVHQEKRPKSDIKDLIQQSHNSVHTEQGLI
jgi:gas vesicle protein